MVRDGGAAVQVCVDEALAASNVVNAADGRVTSVRQRETGLLFSDGADPLVTQISVQRAVTCRRDRKYLSLLRSASSFSESAEWMQQQLSGLMIYR